MPFNDDVRSQHLGLSVIPQDVSSKLAIAVLIELKRNGHGISFPSSTACQMRFKREKKDLGGNYSYSEYGSVSKAIMAAMNRYKQLLVIHPRYKTSAPKGFISFSKRFDKRNNRIGYYYQTFYQKECEKAATKAFYMGRELPNAEQMFHAFRTAKLFRYYFECFGNDFDFTYFKQWRTRRLYEKGEPDVDWFSI